MRLHTLTLAVVVAFASGCASGRVESEGTGGRADGGHADYVVFQSYDPTLQVSHFGIRRNFASSTAEAPVSFNLAMIYQEGMLYGAQRGVPPEIFVWVGHGADDPLGLGETGALTLYIDGSAVVLPGASDPKRRGLLSDAVSVRTDSEFRGGIQTGLRPPSRLAETEFGGGGEFGVYLLPSEVVRQLGSAAGVRFEVRGVEGGVEGQLSGSGLQNVQRFFREQRVQRALTFMS